MYLFVHGGRGWVIYLLSTLTLLRKFKLQDVGLYLNIFGAACTTFHLDFNVHIFTGKSVDSGI